MAGNYEVQFSGQVYRGADPAIVQAQMAQLFGQPVEKMAALFTGEVFVIKQHLSRAEAERYQVQLAKIGARSAVVGVGDSTDVPVDGRGESSSHFTHGDISVAMMICPKCGHQQLDAEFCSRCGGNIEQAHKELRLRAKEDAGIQRELEALRRQAIARDRPGQDPSAAAAVDAGPSAPAVSAEPAAEPAAGKPGARPDTLGVSAVDSAHWLLGVGAGLRLLHQGADLVFLDLVSLLGLSLYLLLATGAFDLQTLALALGSLQADPLADPWLVLVVLGAPMLAMTLSWLVLGASPGMLLVGARILDADSGNRAGFWPLLLRGPALLLALLPLGLGVIWGFFGRRRAWHDLLTGTVVAKPV